jgi:vitamin B12 transporter
LVVVAIPQRHTGAYTPDKEPPVIRSRLFACTFSLCSLFFGVFIPATALAQAPIRGLVSDGSGAAVARVPVRLVDETGATRASGLTDRDGRFTFTTSCVSCTVVAALPGFLTATATPTSDTRLILALAPVQETVVVSATRGAAPSSQVGASVTVFDAAAIQRRGDVLVGDVLRQAPGVAVVQNGGRGNVTSLFVRGGENNYTKVLLDGIPLNEPGGSFNFGGLTSGHFDRIELVRGAQSAVFGSDAMAGVLQLVTARGRLGARPSVAAELSGGGYGSQVMSGRVSGGTTKLDYSVHGQRYTTDNRDPNNRFESNTLSVSAGAALASHLDLRIVGRLEDGTAGAPGQTAFGRPDLDASFQQRHAVGGATLEHRTSRFTQRATYALAISEQRSTNLILDAPYTPTFGASRAPFEFYDFVYDSGSEFRRHHASYQGDVRLAHGGALAGAEILTVALDWDGERGTLEDFLNGGVTAPSRNNVGATLQHQHVSGRLAVTTGVRFEHNASFGSSVVPRLSAALLARSGGVTWGATKVKANAGTGIKEPTLRQSFSLSPFDLGNPDLKAEESRTWDVGLEQRLFVDRAKVEVVWFSNSFTNQISTRTISFSPYTAQYFNVGQTDACGLEVVLDVAPLDGVRLSASHTVVDSEIINASSEFSEVLAAGQWALRRPRHSGQAQLLIDRGRLSADLGATWIGRRNDSDFSSLSPAITATNGHTLWRGQLAWRVVSQATAFVRVDNLTDVDYMEPLGYPAWRRSVHAGLRLKF